MPGCYRNISRVAGIPCGICQVFWRHARRCGSRWARVATPAFRLKVGGKGRDVRVGFEIDSTTGFDDSNRKVVSWRSIAADSGKRWIGESWGCGLARLGSTVFSQVKREDVNGVKEREIDVGGDEVVGEVSRVR
jgi:hypothetical protein